MARRWNGSEEEASGSEVVKQSNRGWLWTLTVLLLGTLFALTFAFRIGSNALNKSRQAEVQAKAATTKAEQAVNLAVEASLRADSAITAAAASSQQVVAISATMHELASQQYAIDVRADRLESRVAEVAAELDELDASVDSDFNLVSARIDSALVLSRLALAKVEAATVAADALPRAGFDALRRELRSDLTSQRRTNRLSIAFSSIANVVWAIHVVKDAHHK